MNTSTLQHRLNRGLKLIAEKHPDSIEPNLAANDYDAQHWKNMLDFWEDERLAPRSCSLRFSHVVREGQPTGEQTIAQETRPAN